jgi:hypothetical protein
MLRGEVRSAVRYLTDREKGGVMLPKDIDEKTGDTVIEVLRSKHPDAKTPSLTSLSSYTTTPDYVGLDISEDAVKGIARRLSGTAGLGGTDSHALKHWSL